MKPLTVTKAKTQPKVQQSNYEKKSWEYVYNYEGMDAKMIEQRKRRIELKKMFENMILGEQQTHQVPFAAQVANPEEPVLTSKMQPVL